MPQGLLGLFVKRNKSLLVVAGVGILLLSLWRFPVSGYAVERLNSDWGPRLGASRIYAGQVKANLWGRGHARDLVLHTPLLHLSFERVEFQLSLSSLIGGPLRFPILRPYAAHFHLLQPIDSLSEFLSSDTLAGLLRDLAPLAQHIELRELQLLDQEGRRLRIGKAFLKMAAEEVPSRFRVELEVRALRPDTMPQVDRVRLELLADAYNYHTELKAEGLLGGSMNATFLHARGNQGNGWSGVARFHRLDLGKVPIERFMPGAILAGEMNAMYSISSGANRFEADMRNLRVGDWDFQKSLLIQSYMPELRSLGFERLEVTGKIVGDLIQLDSLYGRGDTLSVAGAGVIRPKTGAELRLDCRLSRPYYDSLGILVKDALYLDEEGRAGFHCSLRGDLRRQNLQLEGAAVSRAISSQFRKLGRAFGKLFGK